MGRKKLNKQKKTISLKPEIRKKLEFWSTKNNQTDSETIENLVGKYL